MKGTFFARPLEFQINIPGESWAQGEVIKGELIIINHSPEPFLAEDLGVELARGEFKKVKIKSPQAFTTVGSKVKLAVGPIPPKGRAQTNFEFSLDINAPITDKTHSLFLRYGNFQANSLGDLQLAIGPRPIFLKVAEIADVFLRFKTKDWKFNKGEVIIKMIPPETREFIGLEEMHLTLSTVGETIHADYTYKQKNLGVEAGVMKLNKQTTASAQVWTKSDAFLGQDIPNQTRLLALINEALEKVRRKE